jgi:hypothetical protein
LSGGFIMSKDDSSNRVFTFSLTNTSTGVTTQVLYMEISANGKCFILLEESVKPDGSPIVTISVTYVSGNLSMYFSSNQQRTPASGHLHEMTFSVTCNISQYGDTAGPRVLYYVDQGAS